MPSLPKIKMHILAFLLSFFSMIAISSPPPIATNILKDRLIVPNTHAPETDREDWQLTLAGGATYALAIDKNGRTFAGLSGGSIFEKQTDETWTLLITLPSGVYSLTTDNYGNIFAGTADGIIYHGTYSENNPIVWDEGTDFNDYIITSLTADQQGNIFAGTYNGNIFKGTYTRTEPVTWDQGQSFNLHYISAMEADNQGNVFFTALQSNSGPSLVYHGTYSGQGSVQWDDGNILANVSIAESITVDNQGNAFISSRNGFLYHGIYTAQSNVSWDAGILLGNGEIALFASIVDEQGNLFVAGSGGVVYRGIYVGQGSIKWAQEKFPEYDTIIYSFDADDKGNIFAGTASGNVYSGIYQSSNTIAWDAGTTLGGGAITSITSDKFGNLFATMNVDSKFYRGTYSSPNAIKWQVENSLILEDDSISSLLADGKGNLFAATYYGYIYHGIYSGQKEVSWSLSTRLAPTGYIYLAADEQGNIFGGTSSNGMIFHGIYSGQGPINWDSGQVLNGSGISQLATDNAGNVFAALSNSAIYRGIYSNQGRVSWSVLSAPNSHFVTADGQGNVFLTTPFDTIVYHGTYIGHGSVRWDNGIILADEGTPNDIISDEKGNVYIATFEGSVFHGIRTSQENYSWDAGQLLETNASPTLGMDHLGNVFFGSYSGNIWQSVLEKDSE